MSDGIDLAPLDLGHLAQFVGARVNELLLERLAAEGFGDLRTSHGYVFQHLIDGPRTISELARLLGVSQQAASKSVAELVTLGYLESAPDADKRARAIRLSARARASIAVSRLFRAKLEKKLTKKHGAALDEARALLASVLEELGGGATVRARAVREPR
jgi:DNA-binding MarR family transcriptional regulator